MEKTNEKQMTKQITSTGRKVARFTLVVDWMDKFILPNPHTGEMRKRSTFRSDNELLKLQNNRVLMYTECDALGLLLLRYLGRCENIKLYNNYNQKGDDVMLWIDNGVLRNPDKVHDNIRYQQFKKWLNKLGYSQEKHGEL